jgi:integrase/recombinase XerC
MRRFLSDRAQSGGRRGDGRSRKTLREDAIAARAFFDYCVRIAGILESNPLKDYEIPKANPAYVRMPTADELRRLLCAVEDRWNPRVNPSARFKSPGERRFFSRRDYAILCLLIETGARCGDILGLRLDDYQPDRRALAILDPKDDKPRETPITAHAVRAVDAWRKARPRCGSDRLFITQFGERVAVNSFGDYFRTYRRFAGLEGFSLHGIKHYAATTLVQEAGIYVASQVTGTSLETLRRSYIHKSADHVRAEHEKANLLGRVLVNRRTEQRKKKLV